MKIMHTYFAIYKTNINLQLELMHLTFSFDIYYYINKQSAKHINLSLDYKYTNSLYIRPKKGLLTQTKQYKYSLNFKYTHYNLTTYLKTKCSLHTIDILSSPEICNLKSKLHITFARTIQSFTRNLILLLVQLILILC